MNGDKTERLFARMGFGNPTRIQRRAVPRILQRRDCLVIAPTGTGKTECAVLPVFDMIRDDRQEGRIRCLYITPLRALNRDVSRRIESYADMNNLSVRTRHGDTTQTARRKIADCPPDILVSTPETLAALLANKKMLEALSSLKYVIVDEVHEILPSKRGAQLSLSLERLQINSVHDITRIGLSATVGRPREAAKFLVGTRRRCITIQDRRMRPYSIQVKFQKGDIAAVADSIVRYIRDRKVRLPALLFANTRGEAELLASLLKDSIAVRLHHGSLSRQTRQETEESMREGSGGIVVCTSSLELGLDIGTVDLVIQYGSPRQVSKMLQRIGRSRHSVDAPAQGLIITNRADDEFEARAILRQMPRTEAQRIHRGPLDVLAHHMVGVLFQKGPTGVNQILEMAVSAYPYRGITAVDICDILEILHSRYVVNFDRGAMMYMRGGRSLRYHFENLSTIPDVVRFRVFDGVSKRGIGTLDQRFVADNGEVGGVFVLRGTQWRITAVDQKAHQVSVEPSTGGGAGVPYWEGGSIPVDYRTAREVAFMRDEYAAGRTAMECGEGIPVPPGGALLVESSSYRGVLVLHACLGTRINQSLAALLEHAIRMQTGRQVQTRPDAYRVMLESSARVSREMIYDILCQRHDLRQILESHAARTHNANWRVWEMAKRFGVVESGAVYDKKQAGFLQARYAGTPLLREALRDMFHERYDIEGTEQVLRDIRDGSMPLQWRQVEDFSEMARPVLDHRKQSGRIDPGLLQMVKDRLLKTRHRLLCARCGGWQEVVLAGQIREIRPCRRCGARQITATYQSDYDLADIVSRNRGGAALGAEERKRYSKAWKVASLVEAFGARAVIVLSGFGVGPDTAARILRNYIGDENMFEQIYLAEKQYITTRGFWDP